MIAWRDASLPLEGRVANGFRRLAGWGRSRQARHLFRPAASPPLPPQGGRIAPPLVTILAFFFALVLPVFAADLPALTGRVVDNANLIDPATRALLTAKLDAFEKKSSDQIVVATIPSLDGEAIEPYANRLFRAWKLGQAGENNGVLLLVARNDRKMRIEVGYGLEGTLTDLHSSLIINNTLVPAFRAGDFAGGIDDAVDDIVTVLEGNGAELEARARRNADKGEPIDWMMVTIVVVWFSLFFGSFMLMFLARTFGTRIGPGRYRWLGMEFGGSSGSRSRSGRSGGWSGGGWSGGSSSGGGWSSGSSSGGGFSGGGGSSGGGGASGSW